MIWKAKTLFICSCDYVAFHFSVAHHLVSDDIQSELVSELTKLLGNALSLHTVHKRGTLTDTLSSYGQELTRFFKPRFRALQLVKDWYHGHYKLLSEKFVSFILYLFPILYQHVGCLQNGWIHGNGPPSACHLWRPVPKRSERPRCYETICIRHLP